VRLVGPEELSELFGIIEAQTGPLEVAHGRFPAPLDVLAQGPIWDRADVEAWLERIAAARNGGTA
jgi:hypothetical protein